MNTTTIQAVDLEPGDTIVADGAIAIRVTNVRPPVCGLVSVAYEFLGGSGFRIYATTQRVDVQSAPRNCSALCAEHNAGHCPRSGCPYALEAVAA